MEEVREDDGCAITEQVVLLWLVDVELVTELLVLLL